MFCEKCGMELPEGAKFCDKCGAIIAGQEEITADLPGNKEKQKYDLIDTDEHIIKTLGNGYGVNLLYGNAKTCHAILTDRRLYLEGALYSGSGSSLMKSTERRVIDIDDITGTGFVYQKLSIPAVIIGIITVPILIGIIILVKVFLARTTLFVVEYAGGCIKFDANIVGIADVNDFHKQIRRVKDRHKN